MEPGEKGLIWSGLAHYDITKLWVKPKQTKDLLRGLTAHDESNVSIQEKMTLYYARLSWNLSWSDENMSTTFCGNIAPPSLQSQGDREDARMGKSLKKNKKKKSARKNKGGR